jgi:hypothetical protein
MDLQNTMVLPENQLGSNPSQKWTILKSHQGRCIIISDDPDDCRVEITGMKRQITNPPSGDTDSVYTIDGNQTTILMDERSGSEKILIRTYKGDFLNIDVENQMLSAEFANGINFKTNGQFYVHANLINILSDSDTNIEADGSLNILSADEANIQAKQTLNVNGNNTNVGSTGMISINASGAVAIDGSGVALESGESQPAGDANSADSEDPVGDRDS